MFSLMSRMFGNLLLGSCFFSVTLFFLSLAGLIYLLPKLLPHLRTLLRWLLILCYYLYKFILTRLSPYLYQYLNVNVLSRIPRVVASVLLSLALGVLLNLLINFPMSKFIVGVLIFHGLYTGLVWDEVLYPGGFRLGMNIQ